MGPRAARARRALGWVSTALGTLLVFVGATVAGVLLHANHPDARRWIAAEGSRALGGILGGTVTLEHIAHLGLGGVDGVRARVFAPDGRQVLYVDGLRVRLSPLDLARGLLEDSGALSIRLDEVDVDYADVWLDADSEGEILLARAFTPRAEAGPAAAPGGGPRVAFSAEAVTVAHAWAHGTPPEGIFVDADVERLRASVRVLDDVVTVRVAGLELATRAMPRGADLRGHVSGGLTVPIATLRIDADLVFAGEAGGIALHARAAKRGDSLQGAVEVPHLAAERVRALAPEAPIHADGSLTLGVAGVLPDVGAEVHATLGASVVDATVHLRFDVPWQGSLDARVRDLDVRVFAPSAPASRLGADVRANATGTSMALAEGIFDLSFFPGEMGGARLPAAHVRGQLERGTLSGSAHVDEPGLPTDATFALSMNPEPRLLRFTVDAKAPELARISRLDGALGGQGRARVAGTIDLVASTVDARAEAGFAPLHVADAGALRGFVWADLRGSLADPGLIARVELEEVEARGAKVSRVRGSIEGCVHSARITASLRGEDLPRVDLETRLETAPTTTLLGTTLTVAREDVTARFTLDALHFGPRWRVDEARVEGLGAPATFSLAGDPDGFTLRARTEGLELVRVAKLWGVGARVSSGTLALDAEVHLSAREVGGHVNADLTDGSVDRTTGIAVGVDARLQANVLSAQVRASLGSVGSALLETTALTLAGDARDASSWERAAGLVALQADLDLGALTATLPPASRALGDLRGHLEVRGTAERSVSERVPDLDLTLRTKGLSFTALPPEVGRAGAISIVGAPSWRVEGVDVTQRVRIEGRHGETTIRTHLVDGNDAPLATFEGSATIPYEALLARPEDALIRLENAPFRIQCEIPRRALADLPAFVRPERLTGEGELSLALEGTLLAPRAKAVARGYGLGWSETDTAGTSDAEVVLRYDGERVDGAVKFTSPTGARLGATVEGRVRAPDLLAGGPLEEVPWEASLRAHFADFPLELVPAIADAGVTGRAHGEVSLTNLRRDARASAHITVSDGAVGGVPVPPGQIDATYDGKHVDASVRLGSGDGSAMARGSFGMRWGAALSPSLDEGEPFAGSLVAKRFRLTALAPFVESVASDLDGYLDADAHVSIRGGGADGARVAARGTLAIDDGHVQWSAFGDELSQVRLRVELEPTGLVRLRSLTSRSVTGSLSATGEARFDGARFASASAAIRIPASQPIPISVEGQLLAEASGRIDVTAKDLGGARGLAVDVRIPVLRARLPESETRTIQPLDEDPHVRVGTYRNPREFVLIPLAAAASDGRRAADATKVAITVHLGDDVELRRGSELRVALSGTPRIDVGEEVRVSGQIQLLRGELDLQGRSFTIDRGTVTFVGAEAANPEIVASATWESPDGALVVASYAGTVTSGTLTLRSDPPLPESEILALLLFGSSDGPAAAEPSEQASDGTARAIGLGGSFATAGLNRALRDLTDLDVETRIDTTDAERPRPEIAARITQRISVAVAHVLGTAPPGESPDKSFVRLEWRFLRNWSLESTLGDRGSAVFDVVWKKRY